MSGFDYLCKPPKPSSQALQWVTLCHLFKNAREASRASLQASDRVPKLLQAPRNTNEEENKPEAALAPRCC